MNIEKLNFLLQKLESVGWKIGQKQTKESLFNREFNSRYSNIPNDYLVFLEYIESCINPSETAWFLTQKEYNKLSTSAFAWNEFEIQSLEAAQNDIELELEIKKFWDLHLPIMLSIKSAYSFLAIRVSEEDFGIIVQGVEPEYEDVTQIAASFQDFLEQFVEDAKHKSPSSPLYNFL